MLMSKWVLRRRSSEDERRLARTPFRLWMTGSVAVVMLSLPTVRSQASEARAAEPRIQRHSPYGVSETLRRIERAARGEGLGVLARVGGEHAALVLAGASGATLALMDTPDSAPDLPLTVHVERAADGGAEVTLAGLCLDPPTGWQGLPADVLEDLARLPGLVDHALG